MNDTMNHDTTLNTETGAERPAMNEISAAILRLSRALRRGRRRGSMQEGALAALLAVEEGEGLMAYELAERLDIRPSSLSHLLARLEARGLIERQTDEVDRRAMRILLTAEGRQLIGEAADQQALDQRLYDAALTAEEQAAFLSAAHKLAAALEPEDLPGEGPRRRRGGRGYGGAHGCDGDGPHGRGRGREGGRGRGNGRGGHGRGGNGRRRGENELPAGPIRL